VSIVKSKSLRFTNKPWLAWLDNDFSHINNKQTNKKYSRGYRDNIKKLEV
jgi:hypothetical protein